MPEGICGNTLKLSPQDPSIASRGPNLWPFRMSSLVRARHRGLVLPGVFMAST